MTQQAGGSHQPLVSGHSLFAPPRRSSASALAGGMPAPQVAPPESRSLAGHRQPLQRNDQAARAPPRAPVALDQAEKDSRIVEFITLVSTRGCGDLDPEPAVGLLEAANWDVAAAFRQLCGSSPGSAMAGGFSHILPHLAAGDGFGFVPFGGMALDDHGHQGAHELEELNRRIRQEALVDDRESRDWLLEQFMMARQTRRSHAEAGVHDELLRQAPGGRGGDMDVQHLVERMLRRGGEEATDDDASGDDSNIEQSGAARRPRPSMYFGQDFREALRLHALMAHMAHEQDEADFQDALRQSAEEAYSGGFNMPPADEATLESTTSTSIFGVGCEPGQCAVCLTDYEPGDALRTLGCRHQFHMNCVDQWLTCSGQCPVCKSRAG